MGGTDSRTDRFRLSSSEEKKIHSQKAEAIPAVACREAYDSLYTIEGAEQGQLAQADTALLYRQQTAEFFLPAGSFQIGER